MYVGTRVPMYTFLLLSNRTMLTCTGTRVRSANEGAQVPETSTVRVTYCNPTYYIHVVCPVVHVMCTLQLQDSFQYIPGT